MELKTTTGRQLINALLDSGAAYNLVKQHLIVEHSIPKVGCKLPAPRAINGTGLNCYRAHMIPFLMTDSWGYSKHCEALCYAVDQIGPDLVLGMPSLQAQSISIDFGLKEWRFPLQSERWRLEEPKTFEKSLQGAEKVSGLACVLLPQPERMRSEGTALPRQFEDFRDVFSETEAMKLPVFKEGDHAIELEGGEPPHRPIYNLSRTELQELRQYLNDATERGIIRPSKSPAGAPIIFVPKKDGTLRLCVDYRGLNAVTKKNRHPLPLISETLDRLSGAQVYTKLDLRDAYHRIRIRQGDEWKTAFRTRYGHYEYLVMPFGLANAPATFQAYINKALAGLIDVTCVVYIDDILIYSEDAENHNRHVREVLARLRQYSLFAKLSKCEFSKTEVEFLGFIVSTNGVKMDEERIETVSQWPVPTTFKELQQFLGFTNFYRRFIQSYSKLASPLTDLLKGSKDGKRFGPFEWPEKAAHAFRMLRESFTRSTLLIHFNFDRKIRLETDASNFALAAILSQQKTTGIWHPVAFWSRKMIPAERNYEVHDQELLAIVEAFAHWRHYLSGSTCPVEVLTDHNNLRGFMGVKELTPRQARWALRLAAYDFEIKHRPGKTNPADAPSRRPDYEGGTDDLKRLLPTLQNKLALWENPNAHRMCGALVAAALNESGCELLSSRKSVSSTNETAYGERSHDVAELIRTLQQRDAFVQRKQSLGIRNTSGNSRAGQSRSWGFSDGVLTHHGTWYVPEDEALRQELVQRCHDDPLAGHFGAKKTLELLRRKYYWKDVATDVQAYVKQCAVCQRTKVHRHKPYGQLSSLPHPKGPWAEIAMDFITDLPPSMRRGCVYDAILVIVDRYSKMVMYVPTNKTVNAPELADIFLDVITRHGSPEGVVSDRGSVFTSAFWSEICYHLKIKRRLSTAFHPQTDGQTERQNQSLEHYLRCYCDKEQSNWAGLLPMAEFAHNNSYQSSIKMTPFMAACGRNPTIRFEDETVKRERVPSAKERIDRMRKVQESLAENYRTACAAQQKYYNAKHTPKMFPVGSRVLLSTKNLKQRRPSRKLSDKFIGPFKVLDAVGTQAYRLELPDMYKIHPVFHISLLEPYYEPRNKEEVQRPLPEIIEGHEEWEIEKVLDKVHEDGIYWYWVKWKGYGPEENQWVEDFIMGNATEAIKNYNEQRRKQKRKG